MKNGWAIPAAGLTLGWPSPLPPHGEPDLLPRRVGTALLVAFMVCAGAETRDEPLDETPPRSLPPLVNGFSEVRPAAPATAGVDPPLCSEASSPDTAVNKIQIHCGIERGDFAPERTAASRAVTGAGPSRLTVVAWNLERGVQGPLQLTTLLEDSYIPVPDLLLVSEADRGCQRSGYRNVARDLAQGLGMSYVFGVEYVELPRPWGPGGTLDTVCEQGNAILSRYPLDEMSLLRFTTNRSWYESPSEQRAGGGEPRLGGRMAVGADVHLGDRILRAYSFHLESRPFDSRYREAQARELIREAGKRESPVLLGGDANAHEYAADLLLGTTLDGTAAALLSFGFEDAHRRLPFAGRVTHPPLLVIDLIAGRGVAFDEARVGPAGRWGRLSDHLPVWASLHLREDAGSPSPARQPRP